MLTYIKQGNADTIIIRAQVGARGAGVLERLGYRDELTPAGEARRAASRERLNVFLAEKAAKAAAESDGDVCDQ